MKFPSLSRLFGKRWASKKSRRSQRPTAPRAALFLERLEARELLAAPFIVRNAATPLPPDGIITSDPHPILSLTFSEDVNASEARDVANYALFDAGGIPVSIDGATYDSATHQVFILYNGGQPLPADKFTLFVRGDQIHDVDEGLPVAQAGQLVTINGGNSTLSLFDVPGDGTLNASTNYVPSDQGFFAPQPQALAMEDLNGDGVPELIVADTVFAANSIIDIYRGLPFPERGFTSDPTQTLFIPNPTTGAVTPVDMVVTDLDGDNAADIALANTDGTVTIFLNDGTGTILGATSYNAGTNPVALEAADFDGNGSMDLAVALNTTPNNLAILVNSGAGAFGTNVSFATGLGSPSSLAVGDLSGDGLPDIAVASNAFGQAGIQVMTNASPFGGPVNFTPTGVPLAANTAFTAIAIGNVDADPRLDIVAATNQFNNQAQVFLNLGGGNFNQPASFPANPNGGFSTSTTGIVLADADGDGRNDILVANDNFLANIHTVSVLLNLGTLGTFGPPVGFPVDQRPNDLAIHVNASGVVDLAATSSATTGDVTVLRAQGDGTFFETTDLGVPGGTAPSDIESGDLNGDSFADVVFTNRTTNSVTVLLATPGSPAPYGPGTSYAVGNSPSGIALGDLTGTGRIDIVVANQADSTVTVLANNGFGTFVPTAIVPVGNSPTGVALGDFNDDGNLDLAVSHNLAGSLQASDHGVTVSLGRGDRTFGGPIEVALNAQATAIALADFDSDGKLDIAAVEGQSVGTVVLLLGDIRTNLPTSNFVSFSRRSTFAAGENPTSIAVGDLNRDDLPDIVVSNQTVQGFGFTQGVYVSALLNTPGGRFLPAIRTDVLLNVNAPLQSIQITDINFDYFPDVTASFGSIGLGNRPANNTVVTLPGSGDGTFGTPRFYTAAGTGGNFFSNQVLPTYLDVVSNPFIRVTTFSTRGTSVTSNLIQNGTFDRLDLNAEKGNLVGWQQSHQRNSHGYWAPQTAAASPLSAVPVPTPPELQNAAMLDQPDIVLQTPSAQGFVSPGTRPQNWDGSHAFYQDFFIPDSATQVTLSFFLYINNTAGVYADPGTLDYFPDIPIGVRPENQQVRVDIMNPTAPTMDVGPGVLLNVFRSGPGTPAVLGYDADPTTQRRDKITVDLTAFRGRTVRFRVASANNLGKLLVGVDGVVVNAAYNDTQAPGLSGLHMRNPGFSNVGDPVTFGGNTTDPTIVGRVTDDGSPDNIDFIAVDVNNDGIFDTPGVDYRVTNFDAVGNFQTTLPTDLPGIYTVNLRAVDKAGNAFAQPITFNFQGPSLTGWQARGPGPIRFVASGVAYSTVSGRITSIALDPRDTSGNVFYVGSDNGGVWKTTDGGNNWTPLTDFLPGSAGSATSINIGAIAVDPNNPDVVYAATGIADTYSTSHPGFGILKSTDAGDSFTLIATNEFNGATIPRIEISQRRNNGLISVYVVVASGGQGPGVYESVDDGATWTNILDPTKMFLENGQALGAGHLLSSATDFRIDRLSFDQENLWLGMGNIGLIPGPARDTGGVWKSPNHGQTWFRQGGLTAGTMNRGLPDAATYGANIRRVTLAIPSGRPEDEGIVYALISNPGIDAQSELFGVTGPNAGDGRFATGVYKTDDGGLRWSKVMLRENVAIRAPGTPDHDYVDLALLGGTQQEQDAVGALLIDPLDSNVFYVGGSNRFGTFNIPRPHGLLRVDTSNMIRGQDTVPSNAAGTNVNWDPQRGMGDDFSKKADALSLATNRAQPGVYPDAEAYNGEGVFWYDLQQQTTGNSNFFFTGQLQLPATVHALELDPTGRLLVGTEGGIWRGVSQGFTYDTTSGGPFGIPGLPTGSVWSIESDLGVPTPRQGGMVFTTLNGNLQIANQTSVAIDPIERNTLHSSQANLGWAKTEGFLPQSLAWSSTLDLLQVVDPFAQLAPFSGMVRTSPREVELPAAGPSFSSVYRTFASAGSTITIVGGVLQHSNVTGEQGTFTPIITGLDLTGNRALFPPLAVNISQIIDQTGFPFDQLIYGTEHVNRSDTSGEVWDRISIDLSGATVDPITALAIAPTGNHAFYVGTQNGQVYIDLQNAGVPFPNRSAGLPGQQINGITIDPTVETSAYVAIDGFNTGGGHVFATHDAGMTWTNLTGNLLDRPVYALAVDRRPSPGAPNGKLYAGTEVGVFVSTDFLSGAGVTWNRLGVGVPNVPVRDVQFDPVFEKLVVATQGRGTFELSTDEIGPRVDRITPDGPVSGGVSSVTIVFSEPVDPRTFTASQIRLLTGPSGPIQPLAIEDVPDPLTSLVDHMHFRITFSPQVADGIYSLTIGPNLTDFIGNQMDQNLNRIKGEDPGDRFTGTFVINSTDNGRLISGAYHDLFGADRAVDNNGLLFFLGPIDDARAAGLFQVALASVTSDEARTNLIAGLYSSIDALGSKSALLPLGNLLARPATPQELGFWLTALKQGMTEEQAINAIVQSPEYFLKNGQTNAGFVDQVYRDLLGRQSDVGGRTDFIARLEDSQQAGRQQAAMAVTQSEEFRNNLIAAHYFSFLGRAPSAAEVAFWQNSFLLGATDEQVIANLIGSDEYFQNHGSNNATWLNGAYQDILLRAPDAAAQAFYLNRLNQGESRTTVALELLSSDEYFGRVITGYFGKYLRRAPTPAELAFFTDQMRQGVRDEVVLGTILGSSEYFQNHFQGATTLPAQDTNWIKGVFLEVLGRPASDAEASAIVSGRLVPIEEAGRGAIAAVFTTSFEYRNRLVAILYSSFLNRASSIGETNLWIPILSQPSAGAGTPSPDEQLLARILASGEYFNKQREPDPTDPTNTLATNRQWVTSLYSNLLKRTGAPNEIAGTLDMVLNTYSQQRLAFTTTLVNSPEHYKTVIQTSYRTFLRRDAQANEIAFFQSTLDPASALRLTIEGMNANILGEDEYFQNPNLGGSDNSIWLNQIYRDLLGRDRDPSSDQYLIRLNAATGAQAKPLRISIVNEIVKSTEYLNRVVGGVGIGFYSKLLGRVPSSSELGFWVPGLQIGTVRQEDVLAALLASNEYFLRTHSFP